MSFVNANVTSPLIFMDKKTSGEEKKLKGLELRRLRKQRGWRQAQLGHRLHVARYTIHRWEHGNWPDLLTECGIAEAFNLEPQYFENHVRAAQGLAPLTGSRFTITEKPNVVAQLEIIMEANPHLPVSESMTIADVQKQLASYIEFCFHMAMPSGTVTPQGMQRLNDLLQVTPIGPDALQDGYLGNTKE